MPVIIIGFSHLHPDIMYIDPVRTKHIPAKAVNGVTKRGIDTIIYTIPWIGYSSKNEIGQVQTGFHPFGSKNASVDLSTLVN
jgi:hypothetical protein